ncbi:MAG: MFS transporter, partial [Clostridiales bacterium]|nr:MFS transporter [Clostridiales bacterium]
YMVFAGLMFAALSLITFPLIVDIPAVQILCFAVLGFGFSMLRGPIVKMVSENTKPHHARMCCVMLSVSCYAGPLIAGLFALFFRWRSIFVISGIISFLMALLSLISFSMLEKKGIIAPIKSNAKEQPQGGILAVFRLKNFMVYMFIGMIIEISGTAISFWLPTYMSEYLGFPSNVSGIIYSVISLIKSIGPFICLLIFKAFRENEMRMICVMFLLSAIFFVGMSFITNVWINLFLLLLALFTTCCASGVMWSIYIPSLAKSGKVSSANGILDCSGYAAAALATTGFAYVMEVSGWTGTILLWAGIVLVGALLTVFGKKSEAVG